MKSLLKLLFFSALLVTGLFPRLTAAQQQRFNLSFGNQMKIESKILGENRDLFVYLPDSYRLTKDRYPVLYVLDGESNFTITVSIVQFLTRNGRIPELIVVGIPNTARNRDFTPVKVPDIAVSGGGDNFLAFMKDELFPYVERNFRTSQYRLLEGHSLCGMYAFYTMFKQPEMFNAFIAISPWVIHNNNFIVDYASASLDKMPELNRYVYFTAGSLEPKNFLSTLETFTANLKAKAPKGLDWKFELFQNEDHGTVILQTVYKGLLDLYKERRMPDATINQGLAAILDHYKYLSVKYGYDIMVPEFALNGAGYTLVRNGAIDKAIEVFKKNIELYPKSPNTYDSLGETYERMNQMQLAYDNYSMAYKMAQESNDANLAIFRANYERAQKQVASGK